MSESKIVPLQKFLSNVKECTVAQVYSQGTEVKFIQMCTGLQRKPFILHVSNISSTDTSHVLEPTENDYHNFRQRDYLAKIKLSSVACFSKHNLCVKSSTEYNCYLIDGSADSSQSIQDPDESDTDTDTDSDIEIDDYPVKDIYPVLDVEEYNTSPHIEELVLEKYAVITEAEEEMNEKEVQRLLCKFDAQKKQLKERIYSIHQDAYNTRRDLSKCSSNLQRTYLLKERSANERDRVRFQIERLAAETKEKIDALNKKLGEQRNQADSLLKKYWRFIDRFDNL